MQRGVWGLSLLCILGSTGAATGSGLSPEALKACAEAEVAECQYHFATQLEAQGDEGARKEAQKLYEAAYKAGYQQAGPSLLRVLKKQRASAADQGEVADAPAPATWPMAKATPQQSPTGAATRPAEKRQALPPSTIGLGTSGKKFRDCWKATFDTEIRGIVTSFPKNGNRGHYQETSRQPTAQSYVFCYTAPGVAGSGMFAGKNWVQLRHNNGTLAGDYAAPDKTFTRFFFVRGVEPGTSMLQVVPNIQQGMKGSPTIIELRGRSEKVQIAD